MQPKIVKDAGTELLSEGADIFQRPSCEFSQVGDPFHQRFTCLIGKCTLWNALETQTEYFHMNQHGCEILATFIVQFKCEPASFFLLCLHNQHGLFLLCCFQSIKHRVKGLCKFPDFRVRWQNSYALACFPHTHCPNDRKQSK